MEAQKNAKGAIARGILDRLEKLEESQQSMIADIKKSHAEEMEELKKRLDAANQLRRQAEQVAELNQRPILMEVNMEEIEAAVQAASTAAQESDEAVKEVRKVAETARLASKGQVPLLTNGDAYSSDSEYLVKRVSVNLDDVERAINNCDLVEVCRAFGRPDTKYGNEVYCAVVPKRNTRVSEPMMMTYAQKYLPTAMVPKRFFFLDELPSGITRKALADTQQLKRLTQKNIAEVHHPQIEN